MAFTNAAVTLQKHWARTLGSTAELPGATLVAARARLPRSMTLTTHHSLRMSSQRRRPLTRRDLSSRRRGSRSSSCPALCQPPAQLGGRTPGRGATVAQHPQLWTACLTTACFTRTCPTTAHPTTTHPTTTHPTTARPTTARPTISASYSSSPGRRQQPTTRPSSPQMKAPCVTWSGAAAEQPRLLPTS